MQALNVLRGGTLHQHLPDVTALDHLQRHEPFVRSASRGRLRRIAPASRR
jgi:gamma-glutamyl-gamma-aminobutyrate hydrolase PuuD